jgi:hypothetical protein
LFILPEQYQQKGLIMNTIKTNKTTFDNTYREAILTLDLDPRVEARLLKSDNWESLRETLKKRLAKIKLWHYAPDQREAVKTARTYLQNLLESQAA